MASSHGRMSYRSRGFLQRDIENVDQSGEEASGVLNGRIKEWAEFGKVEEGSGQEEPSEQSGRRVEQVEEAQHVKEETGDIEEDSSSQGSRGVSEKLQQAPHVKEEEEEEEEPADDLGSQDEDTSSDEEPDQRQSPAQRILSGDVCESAPDDGAESRGGSSETSTTDDTEASDSGPDRTRRRKRKFSETGEDMMEARPMKMTEGPFNRVYLELLNQDIEDAVSQCVPIASHQLHQSNGGRTILPPSQIGMTVWSSAEKERFFSALGRLGRDDAAGIAARVRTKGEMDVRLYSKLLQDGLALRKQQNELEPLELADFPASIELSDECCRALEQAADSIAVRQDNYEEQVERHRSGEEEWLVTQNMCLENVEETEFGTEEEPLAPMRLFKVENWLRLSQQVFMNTPPEQGNWQAFSKEPPAIRATALADFYSLTVSLTRRLVAATMYVTRSRIRSRRGVTREIQGIIKKKDVEAAAASLGLEPDSRARFFKCARRLGLHVFENPLSARSTQPQAEPMSFEEVEEDLGVSRGHKNSKNFRTSQMSRRLSTLSVDSMLSDSLLESDGEAESELSVMEAPGVPLGQEDEEITAEADEIILHSIVDQPQTIQEREALVRRIKEEIEQERYAEAVDARAAYAEEAQMWALLGRQPAEPLTDPGSPGRSRRTKPLLDAIYSVGKDWRANLKYVSRWEGAPESME